jgi:type I restriction enzyme, S subunit
MTPTSLLEQPVSHLPIPFSWNVTRIGTFATKVGSGATPRGGKAVYLNSRVSHALIRSQHVFDRRFESTGLAFISKQHSDELRNAEVRSGDILLNITGDGVTFARACIVPDEILPACVNQHVSIIRVNQNTCVPGYLLAFLTHPLTKRYIESFNTGGSRRAITKGHIESFEVPLPTLPVQSRIAGILSAYDELIENNQRRIKILEEMTRSLYREWFVHFRFPGHDKVKMVPSSLGPIPQGWEGRFEDLAQVDRDGVNPFEYPTEEFEHFSIPSFDDGRQATIELGEAILSGKYCIDDSCVLLSKLNPRIPRIWLPKPSGQPRAITSTEFLVLKPRLGSTREFIYAKCCSEEFASQFASLAIGTSTSHQRVKPENLLTMPSTVPDRLIIGRFSSVVAPMFILGQQLQMKTQNLRRTRDLLLPRLLSGQISLNFLESVS